MSFESESRNPSSGWRVFQTAGRESESTSRQVRSEVVPEGCPGGGGGRKKRATQEEMEGRISEYKEGEREQETSNRYKCRGGGSH